MEDVPMLRDINISTIVDDHYYKCYPTTIHKENNSPWFFLGKDVKQSRIQSEKLLNAMIWGK